MSVCARSRLRMAVFLVAASFLPAVHSVSQGGEAAPVRIGLAESLFEDVPKPLVLASMIPFKALMEAQTGMRGDMVPINGADMLAAQLDGGKLQIGVMHGIEYA